MLKRLALFTVAGLVAAAPPPARPLVDAAGGAAAERRGARGGGRGAVAGGGEGGRGRGGPARGGRVAFGVRDERGRVRGYRTRMRFPSASLSKAMLLVAALRRAHGRRVTRGERAILQPMVTRSDNDAAWDIYRHVGGAPA